MKISQIDKRGRTSDIKDVHLLIEVADKCNNRCIMCKHSYSDKMHGDIPASFMDPGLFFKIINELKTSKLQVVSIDPLWAGESLMNPHFKEMISYLFVANKKFGICHGNVINTNAFYLDEEITEIFLDYAQFVQEHVQEGYYFRLYFSLDAATPQTYARIKQNSAKSMERVLENIDYFMRQRKKRGLIIPNTAFVFIIMEENKHEAKRFLTYWEKYLLALRVKYEITPTWPLATDRDAIYFRQLICPDIDKAITLHHQVCVALGLISNGKQRVAGLPAGPVVPPVVMPQKRRPCAALWRTPNIQASGIVNPCCRDIDLNLNLGNINDCTIDEIWFGEQIQDLRRAHIQRDLTQYPVCADCSEPEGEINPSDEYMLDDSLGGKV